MRHRLLVGIPLAAVLIGLLLVDGYLSELPPPIEGGAGHYITAWAMNGALSTALVLVLTVFAAHELVAFCRKRQYQPFAHLTLFFAAGLVVGPFVAFNLVPGTGLRDEGWGMVWLTVALGLAFLLQAVWLRTERAMGNLATTLLVIFYAGGLAGFMVKLRMEVGGAEGIALLIYSVFLVKITDAGAYFTGVLVGRHQMVPWLSPKKTWEGFAGGVVVAMVCALGIGYLLLHWGYLSERLPVGPVTGPAWFLLFGLLMALFSVAGDLSASMLKRDAAVKDSGQALPGLGGVLDVIDSPLLAAPVAWFFWTRLVPLWGAWAGG